MGVTDSCHVHTAGFMGFEGVSVQSCALHWGAFKGSCSLIMLCAGSLYDGDVSIENSGI